MPWANASHSAMMARAVRVNSSRWLSNSAEYSMICAVSLATAIRSSTETVARPTIWLIIAWAVAAPTELGYKSEHVALIKRALASVTQDGTSARVFAGAAYLSAGKTGTAQAVTIGQKDKYNASKLEEHQRDHSLYMAFAPVDAPQVALAVVVENAGFGAEHAAPIARRVFDYWLLGQYPSEEDIAAARKGQAAAPIGKPRRADEMAWPPPR